MCVNDLMLSLNGGIYLAGPFFGSIRYKNWLFLVLIPGLLPKMTTGDLATGENPFCYFERSKVLLSFTLPRACAFVE